MKYSNFYRIGAPDSPLASNLSIGEVNVVNIHSIVNMLHVKHEIAHKNVLLHLLHLLKDDKTNHKVLFLKCA